MFQRAVYFLPWLVTQFVLGQSSRAQVPAFEWAIEAGSRSNDQGNSVAVDEAGNCYVAGAFSGVANFSGTNLASFGGTDLFVAKYSAVGALQWVRQAGGAVDDAGRGIAVDSSGDCYVVGDFGWSSGGTANFGTTNVVSTGGTDVFVAKYNSNGDLEWVRTYGGSDFDRGTGITADSQGTVWITGQFGDGKGLAFVAKYDSAGIFQWTQRGGGDYATGVAIAVDQSGNSFITGRLSATGSFGNITLTNKTGLSAFVVKYDSAGIPQWARQTSFTNENVLNQAWAQGIATDTSGNCFVAGYFGHNFGTIINFGVVTLTNAGGHDIFLAKYTADGTPQWAVRGGGGEDDYCNAVATDRSGNCYITGSFQSGSATLGTNLLNGTGERFFIARVDQTGAPEWTLQAEADSYTYSGGSGLAVDRWQNCFVTGFFGAPTAFGGFELAETGDFPGFLDAFVAKLGTNLVSPSIMIQPARQDILDGNILDLRGAASGTTPISYQWELNDVAIPGATNAIFKIRDCDPTDAGQYRFVASNALGGVTSAVATVTVHPFPKLPKFEWTQQAWKTNAFSFLITDVRTDADGNCFVLGQLSGSAVFARTVIDSSGLGGVFFIAKYDRSGMLKWVIKDSAGYSTYPVGIAVDTSGNFLVAGFAFPGPWATNVVPFTARYASSGTRQWIKQEGASRAAADSAGNFYLLRSQSSQVILAKFDSIGVRTDLMQASNSTAVSFNDIALDRLGNIFLLGTFHAAFDLGGAHLVSNGSDDVFLAKLNNTGNLIWIRQGGGTGSDYAHRIAVDGSGQVCISGVFGDRIGNTNSTFDKVTLTARGERDAFLVKYGTEGDVVWARQMSGNFQNAIVNLSADDRGNVFVAATFPDRALLESFTLASRGGTDALVAAYDLEGNLIWLRQLGGTMDDAVAGLVADEFGAAYLAGSFKGGVDFGSTRLTSHTNYMDYTSSRILADLFISKLIPQSRIDIQRQSPQGSNATFQLTLTSEYKSAYLIETSLNLNDWLPLRFLMNTSGSVSFVEQPLAAQATGFYRSRPNY